MYFFPSEVTSSNFLEPAHTQKAKKFLRKLLGGVTTGLGVGETESMQDLVSNSPYCVYGGTGATPSTYGGAELNSECSRSLISQTTAQTSVYGLSTNYHFREGEFDLLDY